MQYTKWYTRAVGVGFTLVAITLVSDYAAHGFHIETLHKTFHVLLGLIVLLWGWRNQAWWRPFALANGAFFSFVALSGWLFVDFGMPDLEALGFEDTLLHTTVGVAGIAAALVDSRFSQT